MMLNKTGIVFFITLMFVAGIIVPVVSAVQDIISGENPTSGLTTYPMISFDGLSTPSNASYNASELKIPLSIKKYELLTFDIPKMREKLTNNETITVRIKGVPYEMNLHDSTGKAEGLDPAVRSYNGFIENVKNSEIGFTIGKQVISGEISIDHVYYYFSSTPKTENGKVIQYVYSSLDVVSEGQPTYWADDYIGRNASATISGKPPTTQFPPATQKASLSAIIPLGVVGMITLIILFRR
jgi:hypothetical protein